MAITETVKGCARERGWMILWYFFIGSIFKKGITKWGTITNGRKLYEKGKFQLLNFDSLQSFFRTYNRARL